jgi:hypothetical protein
VAAWYYPAHHIYFRYRFYDMIMIYLLTAIGLTPGGSITVHIYTHNNTQNNTFDTNNTQNNTVT